MRLARAAGIHVAAVDLRHIPEPVLLIERFDRMPYRNDAGIIQQVERRHTIDGCQALGLAVESKYERLHGHEDAVKHIREGASNKLFFELVGNSKHVASPAATTLAYLRWLIFQVLIGNGDAHAKNVTFFCGPSGLSLAPAYDLVCTRVYASDIESSLAMAIGDQFDITRIKPYDWAQLAAESALPPRLLATQISKLASLCLDGLAAVTEEAEAANADMDSVRAVSAIIRTQCEFALSVAPDILRVDKTLF
jgi:serine/threonine-protein kinase HipA